MPKSGHERYHPHSHLLLLPQTPAKPKTPYGEMLSYYLRMEPQ